MTVREGTCANFGVGLSLITTVTHQGEEVEVGLDEVLPLGKIRVKKRINANFPKIRATSG